MVGVHNLFNKIKIIEFPALIKRHGKFHVEPASIGSGKLFDEASVNAPAWLRLPHLLFFRDN